jgi:hypothetical protein
MKRFVIITIALLLLTGCSQPRIPYSVQAKEFTNQLGKYIQLWDDANDLASRTPRVSLAPQLQQLQSIRRGVTDLDTPVCALEVKRLMLDFMSKKIDAYLLFMSNESDWKIAQKFEASKDALKLFNEEYMKLKTGSPPYD